MVKNVAWRRFRQKEMLTYIENIGIKYTDKIVPQSSSLIWMECGNIYLSSNYNDKFENVSGKLILGAFLCPS